MTFVYKARRMGSLSWKRSKRRPSWKRSKQRSSRMRSRPLGPCAAQAGICRRSACPPCSSRLLKRYVFDYNWNEPAYLTMLAIDCLSYLAFFYPVSLADANMK